MSAALKLGTKIPHFVGAPECFPHCEVTLDITEGKLFPEGNLEERQRANQENVHA
jgi:hypothetical protein